MGPTHFGRTAELVLGADAPRPSGRRVRGVQFGQTAELVSVAQEFVQGSFCAGLGVHSFDDDGAGEGIFAVLGG